MPSLFFSGRGLSVHFGLSLCGCLVALLDFFSVGLCVEKKCKCATKCVGFRMAKLIRCQYKFVLLNSNWSACS